MGRANVPKGSYTAISGRLVIHNFRQLLVSFAPPDMPQRYAFEQQQ
jgi:hypothetical protein